MSTEAAPSTTPSLDGAVVFITGANGGLGREFVAQALARGAAKVYATARTPREWGDPRVVALPLDVTSADSIAAAAVAAQDATVVINNAGISPADDDALTTSLDEVRHLFEVNVFGPLAINRAFAPVLAANGGGSFIQVHSALSWASMPVHGSYGATKAALWSLSNVLRIQLAEQGTHVVGLHFGYTDTPMTGGIDSPKNDPADVVRAALDGLERGEHEVLADGTARNVKSALSSPIEVLYPFLAK
ncbi:SDR family oxidoreductase [Plantibacter sp. YIM 135249]|uniref:SDR family oxidoreductase n=1 Tax=Plantibacter sp. YIM 135249 TaxID=3423918 RepID=UPI003D332BA7